MASTPVNLDAARIADLAPHQVAVMQYAHTRGLVEMSDTDAALLSARYTKELLPAMVAVLKEAEKAGGTAAATRSVRDHLWLAEVIEGTFKLSAADQHELDRHARASVERLESNARNLAHEAARPYGEEGDRRALVGGLAGAAATFAASGSLAVAGISLAGATAGTPLEAVGMLGFGFGMLGVGVGSIFGGISGEDFARKNGDHPLVEKLMGLTGSLKRSNRRPKVITPEYTLARLEAYIDAANGNPRMLPTPEHAREQAEEEQRRIELRAARLVELEAMQVAEQARNEAYDLTPAGQARLEIVNDTRTTFLQDLGPDADPLDVAEAARIAEILNPRTNTSFVPRRRPDGPSL
jgi:hypothetical protein